MRRWTDRRPHNKRFRAISDHFHQYPHVEITRDPAGRYFTPWRNPRLLTRAVVVAVEETICGEVRSCAEKALGNTADRVVSRSANHEPTISWLYSEICRAQLSDIRYSRDSGDFCQCGQTCSPYGLSDGSQLIQLGIVPVLRRFCGLVSLN